MSNSATHPIMRLDQSTGRKAIKRVSHACEACQQKRRKCDGIRPSCSRCLKYNGVCRYKPKTRTRMQMQVFQNIETLQSRMTNYEQTVASLEAQFQVHNFLHSPTFPSFENSFLTYDANMPIEVIPAAAPHFPSPDSFMPVPDRPPTGVPGGGGGGGGSGPAMTATAMAQMLPPSSPFLPSASSAASPILTTATLVSRPTSASSSCSPSPPRTGAGGRRPPGGKCIYITSSSSSSPPSPSSPPPPWSTSSSSSSSSPSTTTTTTAPSASSSPASVGSARPRSSPPYYLAVYLPASAVLSLRTVADEIARKMDIDPADVVRVTLEAGGGGGGAGNLNGNSNSNSNSAIQDGERMRVEFVFVPEKIIKLYGGGSPGGVRGGGGGGGGGGGERGLHNHHHHSHQQQQQQQQQAAWQRGKYELRLWRVDA